MLFLRSEWRESQSRLIEEVVVDRVINSNGMKSNQNVTSRESNRITSFDAPYAFPYEL